jgi:hypothetical protein
MADFNWCHGPQCHEKHTVDRVRGVKGSKVLRTRKIKLNQYVEGTQWGFFCSQGCQNDFWKTHATQIVAIAPRTECQETPIHDPKKETLTHEYSWGRHSYTNTKIEVDETRQS